MERLADKLNDSSKRNIARIKISFILLSAGLFKETYENLTKINTSQDQPDSVRAEYYSLMCRYYLDLGHYNNDIYYTPAYTAQRNLYIDSALALYPPGSFDKYHFTGLKSLKEGHVKKAYTELEALLNKPWLTQHQVAIIASTLGSIYLDDGQITKSINYQIRAAVADIRSSTKETYAIFNLAQLLFKQGDFERASVYIEKAIDDASFYGARLRKVQVSTILPIIQGKKISYVEDQRKLWITYGAIASFLLLLLVFLLIIIYRQFNKLKKAKQTITDAHVNLREANANLHRANADLHELNSRLSEANKIKEEYIGYFFNINSEFFLKINRFKRSLEKKINDRKLEDVRTIVNSINVNQEKEELLKSFDKVFLKLFPNFVKEFNALFHEEDQVKLKDNEFLNTDLRIYALIRMGITDTEKIAQILEYSVNTIYTYKAKIKHKSIVSKDDFEKRIMDIGA
jgi:tetratricopeptide (TPR) repeat protein